MRTRVRLPAGVLAGDGDATARSILSLMCRMKRLGSSKAASRTAGLESLALLIVPKASCRTLMGCALMSSTSLRARLVLPLAINDRGAHIPSVVNIVRCSNLLVYEQASLVSCANATCFIFLLIIVCLPEAGLLSLKQWITRAAHLSPFQVDLS